MRVKGDGVELILHSIERQLARINSLSDEEQQFVSPQWLAAIENQTEPDPWMNGFAVVDLVNHKTEVGECGFKGAPDAGGMVEIAYHTFDEFEGQGFATRAARALIQFAFNDNSVKLVRAHTLAENNASTSILKKCGFTFVGEFDDPEDGPVWRWELTREITPF